MDINAIAYLRRGNREVPIDDFANFMTTVDLVPGDDVFIRIVSKVTVRKDLGVSFTNLLAKDVFDTYDYEHTWRLVVDSGGSVSIGGPSGQGGGGFESALSWKVVVTPR